MKAFSEEIEEDIPELSTLFKVAIDHNTLHAPSLQVMTLGSRIACLTPMAAKLRVP
jgi:hypothetical protein